MSDHGHGAADEAPRNRAWLTVVLLVAAVFFGGRFGTLAAPHAPQTPSAGPAGVVVVDEGEGRTASVERGTLIVRGDSVVVLKPGGSELQIPRSHVRWFDADRSSLTGYPLEDYPLDRFPLPADEAAPLAPAPAEPAPEQAADAEPKKHAGCVVLNNGDVLVGWIERTAEQVVVSWPYGDNHIDGEVRVPRGAIRWFEVGTDRPSATYWKQFGDLPIDSRYARPSWLRPQRQVEAPPVQRDPAIVAAERAQLQGDFAEAARAWARIYVTHGFKEHHRQQATTNLNLAWGKAKTPDELRAHIALIEEGFAGHLDRGEVQQIYGNALIGAARACERERKPDAAREFAGKAIRVGGPFVEAARKILVRLDAGR